ncbi:MAG: hypothetical protein OXB84_03085, partial [Halobacteriovoraceae bacterium]|nr:hypothetical protein [Halobacteriovoraceae bacterium]
NFNGSILRKKDGKYGDYFFLKGVLKASFHTYCVKSGNPMLDTINVEVKSAILDDEAKNHFQEKDTICLDENQLDLYYYKDNCFDMQKILHEYLFLNKNPYPHL